MKEGQGNVRTERTSPSIHKMRLRRCGPERGLDWRGVAYAVVLTAQGGEGGKSAWRRQQRLRRDERGLEREGQRMRNGGCEARCASGG